MEVKDLLKKMEGLTAEEQAKMISNYVADSRRKKTIEEQRKEVRAKVFAGCKKLSKAQQESLLYEFINANAGYINNWMHKQHPELNGNTNGSK